MPRTSSGGRVVETDPVSEVPVETPADQLAGPLLRKLAKALSRPGIRREVVFGANPPPRFFAYSLDPTDSERMIRENAAGQREVGRMVNGRFRKIRDLS